MAIRNITGGPVTGEDLFGRESLIDGLWEELGNGQNLHVLAPRRTGKTSILQELQQNPRPGWTVIYLTVEGAETPTDAVTGVVAALRDVKELRTWMDEVKGRLAFLERATKAIGKVHLETELFKVELRAAIGSEWRAAAEQLADQFENLPQGMRLLVQLDELPILVNKMVAGTGGKAEAASFLEWFRSVRQNSRLRNRIQFIVAGSVGLPGVLFRHRMPASINDLSPVKLRPWTRATALKFLRVVGKSHNFVINEADMETMLDRIGPVEIIPYHLQLYFKQLRELADRDPEAITPELLESAYGELAQDTHMDHYVTRLAELLPPEENQLALDCLARLCRFEGKAEIAAVFQDCPLPDRIPGLLRILSDDGYVEVSDDMIRFRTSVLKSYWRKRQAVGRTGDYA